MDVSPQPRFRTAVVTNAAFLALALALVTGGCSSGEEATSAVEPASSPEAANVGESPSPYLYLWAGDVDRRPEDSDFMAVVDADPESPGYGTILSTAVVGSAGNDPHHAELAVPDAGLLMANGFNADRTFLFDVSDRAHPEFAGELDPVPGYRYLHSFVRLENGHVLATMQNGDGTRPGDAGGVAEFDPNGNLVRTSSAEDTEFPGALIRPYSLLLLPDIDRFVTTGMSMHLEESEDVVQVWRISDLDLVVTLAVPAYAAAREPGCTLAEAIATVEGPEGAKDCGWDQVPGHTGTFEVRPLPDGSAIINTFLCGFYRIDSLAGENPRVEPLMNWPEAGGCSVPTRVGRFLVMPVLFSNEVVTLDVSDPNHPVEVSRLAYDEPFLPHYAQVDEGTNRLVLTGAGPAGTRVFMYSVDMESGELVLDEAFGDAGQGLSMDREDWPHGPSGAALPHAAMFGS